MTLKKGFEVVNEHTHKFTVIHVGERFFDWFLCKIQNFFKNLQTCLDFFELLNLQYSIFGGTLLYLIDSITTSNNKCSYNVLMEVVWCCLMCFWCCNDETGPVYSLSAKSLSELSLSWGGSLSSSLLCSSSDPNLGCWEVYTGALDLPRRLVPTK